MFVVSVLAACESPTWIYLSPGVNGKRRHEAHREQICLAVSRGWKDIIAVPDRRGPDSLLTLLINLWESDARHMGAETQPRHRVQPRLFTT
jgi:hypothetical protein